MQLIDSADAINVMAEQHLQETLDNGEAESMLTSHHSQKSHVQPLVVPGKTSDVGQKRKDAKAASERLVQLEDEQREKELELEKVTAELQLSKLRGKKNHSTQQDQIRCSRTSSTTIGR